MTTLDPDRPFPVGNAGSHPGPLVKSARRHINPQRRYGKAPAGRHLAPSNGCLCLRVLDQAALKTYSQQVFEQTFAATSALNTLTLGVAAVALLTSLLSLADARLGQLAPLWAMGLRPSSLAGLSLAQMLLLAIITWLTAIPLGKLLAWCLVDVVNVQAFGWRLPLYWFPMQWLQLGVMALLAVLLASTWPLWRILHSGTSALLRRFANDS